MPRCSLQAQATGRTSGFVPLRYHFEKAKLRADHASLGELLPERHMPGNFLPIRLPQHPHH